MTKYSTYFNHNVKSFTLGECVPCAIDACDYKNAVRNDNDNEGGPLRDSDEW